MDDNNRNRAQGWKHAKQTGHLNENKIEYLLLHDTDTQKFFLNKIKKPNCKIISAETGGIYEKDVASILNNGKTKTKTDLVVSLSDGSKYNVSIKKSLSGQVFLIGILRFIEGFEKQYKITIPDKVKQAISFFWGSNEETRSIIKFHGTNKNYENRKNRLVAETLKIYDEFLYDILIEWFRENIKEITQFCFSRGLVLKSDDWADIIWYKNEIGENEINEIFLLDDLYKKIKNDISLINYGKKGGGTTISLPFGFVQWHSPRKKIPGDMQFHHDFKKLKKLLKKDK